LSAKFQNSGRGTPCPLFISCGNTVESGGKQPKNGLVIHIFSTLKKFKKTEKNLKKGVDNLRGI